MESQHAENPNSEPPDLILPIEAARQLGVSTTTLRRYERDGWIKARRIASGHRRYNRADVCALARTFEENAS